MKDEIPYWENPKYYENHILIDKNNKVLLYDKDPNRLLSRAKKKKIDLSDLTSTYVFSPDMSFYLPSV